MVDLERERSETGEELRKYISHFGWDEIYTYFLLVPDVRVRYSVKD